jgi:hypothetical protein
MKRIQFIILRLILSIISIALVHVLFCKPIYPDQKIPVEVASTAKDHIGKILVFKIKEEIRKSNAFKVTQNNQEHRLKLIIVTMDPFKNITVPGYAGQSTNYSLVIVASGVYFNDIFLTTFVGNCPILHTKQAAENIVAELDDQISSFETAKNNWNKFGEIVKGALVTKDQKFQTETQKLMNEIGELTLKVSDLEEKLNKEKAKKWWIKLWESFK